MDHDVVPLAPLVPRRPSAWRRTIGALLRAAREDRGLRLVDVAARARLSPQYLSEVERGLKEPSSEVLAALTDALGLTLVDLAEGIAAVLGRTAVRGRVGGTVRSLSALPGRADGPAAPRRPDVLLAA
ncbi:helix-turn-helix transcriptional regulator [Cellulomonas sp. zg-ZUI222]|uniref:Helix-turn-helix transcriptional regulator n=1 Tax=Cellulomonas wangleii TaxID=2816956 RepID=A0ABX8D1R7_9CELL|nr:MULTISPECIES: helix-turn-helix transcriptional regulator [Cellulomonas]MBO0900172.1 helix-turn-helix transcriptional regulator [Cellulomonas sp. zg-ZUI22]MBO0920914.1 helix-turn-helix transcriptional regulator [Cellulomonas wangleii]MBO0925606.1 helix-turn-helix transcriptional regulator [Cellulomonas wangleii]QVI60933.1 helix-turn-helix transcriptional regulator [Cellulomonas wangleii]